MYEELTTSIEELAQEVIEQFIRYFQLSVTTKEALLALAIEDEYLQEYLIYSN